MDGAGKELMSSVWGGSEAKEERGFLGGGLGRDEDGGAAHPRPTCKPAGGGGKVEKPDRRSQGGDGGARVNT